MIPPIAKPAWPIANPPFGPSKHPGDAPYISAAAQASGYGHAGGGAGAVGGTIPVAANWESGGVGGYGELGSGAGHL